MRLAYFSPLPPKRTGVATYSWHLSKVLGELTDLHLFDAGVSVAGLPAIPCVDIVSSPPTMRSLESFDALLYHLGNNPFYHSEIYDFFLRKPGIVVLHDTVLYFLMAGLGMGGFLKEFVLNYGVDRIPEAWDLVGSCPDNDILRYGRPENYPLLGRVLSKAHAVIVHSRFSEATVRQMGYRGRVEVVGMLSKLSPNPLPREDAVQSARVRFGIPADEVMIGCFGFGGRTKRIEQVVRVLAKMRNKLRFKLLVIGEGDEGTLDKAIRQHGMGDHVIQAGFVDDETFETLMVATDVVVNLRYPSMGEASATLVQAMSQGKPCVVTDHAWFSELPDDCVAKISCGEKEEKELEGMLARLLDDKDLRAGLGRRAREFAENNCDPMKIAEQYMDVLRGEASARPATVRERIIPGPERPVGVEGDLTTEWTKRYLLERTSRAIPD